MRFDLHAVGRYMRAADTESLLDRVTVYRTGMEPAALDLIEGELHRRGVKRSQIADHEAERRAVCLFHPDGMAIRCDRCERPAVRRGWAWHRVWGLLPVFPVHRAECQQHTSTVADPSRLA